MIGLARYILLVLLLFAPQPSRPHAVTCGASCVVGDPHISFANGGGADFRGSHRDYYAFISSPGYLFAPYFQEIDFWYATVTGLKQLIHGTFMTKAVWHVRTSADRTVIVMANAMERGELDIDLVVLRPKFMFESKKMRQGEHMVYDDVRIQTRMLTATVETPFWVVNITSKPIYGLIQPWLNTTHTTGRYQEDQRRFDITVAGVFPQPDAHGVIGQSYRDSTVHKGKRDEYGIELTPELANSDGILSPMTTSAQAEGAIEGVHTDYKLRSALSTDFKFTRYHLLPRSARRGAKSTVSSTDEWDGDSERWEARKGEPDNRRRELATCLCPPPSPPPSPPIWVPTDSDALRTAVGEWCTNSAAAEVTYGAISTWGVSSLTSFDGMFSGTDENIIFGHLSESSAVKSAINACDLPIGAWDTSSVTNYRSAFQYNTAFNQDLSGWVVSGNLNNMFASATSFNQDLSGWDVSNVQYFANTFTSSTALSNCNKRAIHDSWGSQTANWADCGYGGNYCSYKTGWGSLC